MDLHRSAARLGAGLFGGMACGFLIGGLGGRVAMLVLRLTSDSSVRGRMTEDGFMIGELSSSTLFLWSLSALLGGVGGLFYLAVRTWLPRLRRSMLMGAFTAVVGGSVVVEPGRRELTAVEPLWLVVVLFIALPALYGLATSALVEHLLENWHQRVATARWLPVLAVVALVLMGLPGMCLLALLGLGWALRRRSGGVARLGESVALRWTGRVLLTAIGATAALDLADNVRHML